MKYVYNKFGGKETNANYAREINCIDQKTAGIFGDKNISKRFNYCSVDEIL